MFTGIIQSVGNIESIDSNNNTFSIRTDLDLNKSSVGTSICCDGVCLTAVDIIKDNNQYLFLVNVGEETIKRSNLSKWNIGYKINLEKSLKLGDEISGHFVYGHVDVTLNIINITKLENSWEFEFSFYPHNNIQGIKKFIVEKGSIAINGISLTVANTFEDSFKVSIIPHTYLKTNLFNLNKNDTVNIEFDPLSRYIRKLYDN